MFGTTAELIEDVAEPIVGWRSWDRAGSKLCSIYMSAIWLPEGIEARCQCPNLSHAVPECHQAPGKVNGWAVRRGRGYGCGIYAMKSYHALRKSSWSDHPIHGRVELGGRVWEHDYGYRAQLARITGLVVPQTPIRACDCPICENARVKRNNRADMIRSYAKLYGVPVLRENEKGEVVET